MTVTETIKSALAKVEAQQDNFGRMDRFNVVEHWEVRKALEKQIPRELTSIRKVKQYDGYDMENCPICGEPLDNSFYEKLKYCFVCGQRIDWGNEDDRAD